MALRGIERYFNKTGLIRTKQVVIDGGVAAGGTPARPPLHIIPTEAPTLTPAEGDFYFDDDDHTLYAYNGSAWVPAGSVGTADSLKVAGVIVPATVYWNFHIHAAATVTEYDLAIAKRAFQVVSIDVVPSTLQGGALTATIVKTSSTDTPVKTTTPLHTADSINLNTGAYTVQSITLTSTAADLVFAAGNRLSIDFSAAYSAGHAALTIGIQYV